MEYMAHLRPVIALLTDFGLTDNFVGVMKGVIARHCPEANVIDLAHGVPRHSVLHAALTLLGSWRHFPEGTVFAVVVDPDVGTERKIVAVRAGAYTFIAPDNGCLSPVADAIGGAEYYEITYRPESGLSSTFHGRDIFAPVAGMLAAGKSVKDLGKRVSGIARFEIPKPRPVSSNSIAGEIVYIDSFGNAMSNISRADMRGNARIRVGTLDIDGICASYAEKETGRPLAIFNSFDMLEIAVNKGSASGELGISIGQQVVVEFKE